MKRSALVGSVMGGSAEQRYAAAKPRAVVKPHAAATPPRAGRPAARARHAMMFLAPAMCFFILFMVYPVAKNIYNSFFYLQLAGPRSTYSYVGLKNFYDVLRDPVFWRAARNSLTWAVLSCVLEIPLAFVLAFVLAFEISKPGARILRNVWFVPVLLTEVMAALLSTWVYQPKWGLLNSMLRMIGLGRLSQLWLADPKLALYCLIMATTWKWTGFNMVLYLAGLTSLPQDLIEATLIDGANRLQRVRYLILPLLKPLTYTLLVLCFIGKMKIYGLVWVATSGGPLWSTETVATYMVKRAFSYGTFEMGYPSAMASIWFVVVLAVATFFTMTMRRGEVIQY